MAAKSNSSWWYTPKRETMEEILREVADDYCKEAATRIAGTLKQTVPAKAKTELLAAVSVEAEKRNKWTQKAYVAQVTHPKVVGIEARTGWMAKALTRELG